MNDSEKRSGVVDAHEVELTADVVRRHLLRILSSEAFQGSRRSGTLLESLVEALLDNRPEDLKEHRLAQQYFPDLSGFNSSSIYKMRGVVKRMRGRLQAYYRTEGRFDDIIISFPNSLYVPDIVPREGKVFAPGSSVSLRPAGSLPASAADRQEGSPTLQSAMLRAPSAPHENTGTHGTRRRHSSRHSKSRRSAAGYRWAIAGAVAAVPVLAGIGVLLSSRSEILAPLPEFARATRITSEDELAIDPALSSNGKYLVYASDKGSNGNLNIWMINLDDKSRTARRITRNEFEENQPAVSPDGNTIVFRSVREAGGLWIVPANGGEPRLLAKGGRRPRFSPDGKHIAYWALNREGGAAESRLFVVPAGGGTPRRLAGDFQIAEHPTWSPDGQRILFVGRPVPQAPKNPADEIISEPNDWWVTTPDGGTPIRTAALPTGTSDILFGPPGSWTPYTNRILADSMQAGQRQPVAVAMNPAHRRIGGTENLSSPGVANAQPFLANGRLVSSRVEILSQLAAVPVDGSSGEPSGPLKVLSQKSQDNDFLPALNPSGGQVTYVSESKGSFNAFLRDLPSGVERRISSISQGWSPIFSRDGRILAVLYPNLGQPGSPAGRGAVEIHSPSGAGRPVPCGRCERLIAVSNDGNRVLYMARNPRNPAWIGMLDIAGRKHTTVLGHPSVITSADWSRDERLIAFGNLTPRGGNQLMIAAFSGSGEASKPVPVTDGEFSDDRPRFSPDGKFLYFLSDRDRYSCIYSLRIDPASGKPQGAPRAVHHFHQRRLAIDAVPAPVQGLSITAQSVALTVQRVRSGIFFAESR